MFRFYTSTDKVYDTYVEMEQSDINHIKNVLRMKVEDHIIVCDGHGNDMECRISRIENETVLADIVSRKKSDAELDTRITLYQGLPKKDKMELIIQKAVELGVHKVVPVDTAHTVVKIDSRKEEKVVSRWQSISEAAAKQSGRGIIPEIGKIVRFENAIKEAKMMDGAIIPYEKAHGIAESKRVIYGLKGKKEIAVFIGPEGGFSNEEIALAMDNNVLPVTLGHRILRTETAGLTILSILMFEFENN